MTRQSKSQKKKPPSALRTKISSNPANSAHKSTGPSQRLRTKIRPRKKPASKANIPLDAVQRKRGRPRQTASPESVLARARHLEFVLRDPVPVPGESGSGVWRIVQPFVLAAQGTDEMRGAFTALRGTDEGNVLQEHLHERMFYGLEEALLEAKSDRDFPKSFNAQVRFVARSLAGGTSVTPRRSRAICHEAEQ